LLLQRHRNLNVHSIYNIITGGQQSSEDQTIYVSSRLEPAAKLSLYMSYLNSVKMFNSQGGGGVSITLEN